MKTEPLEISREDAIKYYDESPKVLQELFEDKFGKEVFSKENQILKNIVLPYNEDTVDKWERQLNATLKLLNIAKYYNNGWEPDWNNSSEYKYYIYAYRSGSGWVISYGNDWDNAASYPSGVCFRSREICEEVVKKYPEIIKDFLMIS